MERGVKYKRTAGRGGGQLPRGPLDLGGGGGGGEGGSCLRSCSRPGCLLPAARPGRPLSGWLGRFVRAAVFAWHLPSLPRGQRGTSGGHHSASHPTEQCFQPERSALCIPGCTAPSVAMARPVLGVRHSDSLGETPAGELERRGAHTPTLPLRCCGARDPSAHLSEPPCL